MRQYRFALFVSVLAFACIGVVLTARTSVNLNTDVNAHFSAIAPQCRGVVAEFVPAHGHKRLSLPDYENMLYALDACNGRVAKR